MQENNFEKQVQQKTDELKLMPSDEVWQKVSSAIAERKTGRWVLAIFFLLFLLAGSATFMIWDHITHRKINAPVADSNHPAEAQSANEPLQGNNSRPNAAVKNSPEISNAPANKDEKITGELLVNNNTVAHTVILRDHQPGKATAVPPVKAPRHGAIDALNPDESKVAENDHSIKPGLNTGPKINAVIHHGEAEYLYNETIVSKDLRDTTAGDISLLINSTELDQRILGTVSKPGTGINDREKNNPTTLAGADLTQKIKSGEKKALRVTATNKWNFGLSLSLGVAATKNGYLGIIGSGVNDESKAYSSADQSQAPGGNAGQNGTGAYDIRIPSKIRTGLGLVAGIYLQKNISRKTNLLLGLNYKAYNSAMLTGNRVDSFSNLSRDNFFYRAGNSYRYKNHFHFIELPVALRFRLGRQNRLPVYLNAGISIARLVGSNALQFDTLSRSYYSGNAGFNKTQVSLSAGVLFSFFNRSKSTFLAGPDINYSLNKMTSSGLYSNRHYSYFGIIVQKNISRR